MAQDGGSDRFMLIGPERILYVGLLGTPSVRTLGGVAIYVPLSGQARVEAEGHPARFGEAVAVPAYAPHRVEAAGPDIACILVEPETVAGEELAALLRRTEDPDDAARLAAEVRAACVAARGAPAAGFRSGDFDRLVFGTPLRPRELDPRIAAVVSRVQAEPTRALSGGACASRARLSPSRFLHLFRDETATTFRTFRAWKRARDMLHHVNRPTNLARLALDIGYPDSTHFSHSVRRIYGLRPSQIFSGSRRLQIVRGGAGA